MFSRKHIDTNIIMIYLYQVYKKAPKVRVCPYLRVRPKPNRSAAARKRHLFWSFSYVCPEPVLVKCSFLVLKRPKSGVFLPVGGVLVHDRDGSEAFWGRIDHQPTVSERPAYPN